MNRILLALLAMLLVAAPIELSAEQVIKQHTAKAQAKKPVQRTANPNCVLGGPGGVSCGFSDLSLPPHPLANTDTIQICQDPTGCWTGEGTVQINQAPLSYWETFIRSKFSASPPLVYTPATGAFTCPTCGSSSGGGLSNMTAGQVPIAATSSTVTSSLPLSGTTGATQVVSATSAAKTSGNLMVWGPNLNAIDGGPVPSGSGTFTPMTLSPGLTSAPGTYNPGTQTVGSGGTISPQLFWEGHGTSYTVVAADAGKLLEATAGSVVFTLPSPIAAGGPSYSFSYGNFGYSVQTPSATIYGCGATVAANTPLTVGFDTAFVSAGGNWKCIGSGNQTPIPLTWGPGANLATSPLPALTKRTVSTQVVSIQCLPGVVVGGTPALIDLYSCPDGASSIPPSGTGCTKITSSASCIAGTGTGGGAGVTQSLTPTTLPTIPIGNSIWAVGSGAGWATANVANSSGVISVTTSP